MLAKSWKSVLVMEALFIFTAVAVTVCLGYYGGGVQTSLTRETTSGGADSSALEPVVLWIGLIFVAVFALAIGALRIRQLDDAHFGLKGALRWMVFGMLFALSVRALMLLRGSYSVESPWQAAFYTMLRDFLGFLLLVISYCLAFWRVPFFSAHKLKNEQAVPRRPVTSILDGIDEMLARIRQNPESRLNFLVRVWFFIGCSVLVLAIALTLRAHSNPYLPPSLIFAGLAGVSTGGVALLFLRQSKVTPWLMLLDSILFMAFLVLLVLTFTYLP